jgi:uncharacterized protein with NRDE domain
VCLIAFQWQPDEAIPLIVAANRDEFYERPTAPLAWWEGGRILAGRDLKAGGTWLGVSADGRWAALTNYRDPTRSRMERTSRGQIPVRFLQGGDSALAFIYLIQKEGGRYNPFNLMLFDGKNLLGYESRHAAIIPFTAGIHAVSNGDFDAPWPKVEALKSGFGAGQAEDDTLLALLGDARPFKDDRLPCTGVSLEWERALSPAFVRTPTYGTRAATILRLGRETVSLLEQRFSWEGLEGRSVFRFRRSRRCAPTEARVAREF